MNVYQILQKLPAQERKQLIKVIKKVTEDLTDSLYDKLNDKQKAELSQIQPNDQKAQIDFVKNNFKNLDDLVIKELSKYLAQK